MNGFLETDPQLIGAIAHSIDGPILVIGGGPSVPRQLEELVAGGFKPKAVISANGHGFKQTTYGVDFVFCCDAFNQETRQNNEHAFRVHGKPIITPCHFGDFRLAEWKMPANSGLTAIAVGAMLMRGDHPLVAIGIDCYRMGDKDGTRGTYFHNPKANSNSLRKRPENFDKQIAALQRALGDFKAVRQLGGELAFHFAPWDPHESRGFGAGRLGVMLEYVLQLQRLVLLTGPSKRCQLHMANIETSRRIAVSEDEAFRIVNSYQARVVAPETHSLFTFRKGKPRPIDLLPSHPDQWDPLALRRR